MKARLSGNTVVESLKYAGFPAWMRAGKLADVEEIVSESVALLEQHAVECALIDTAELHEQVTDELRGDIAELYFSIDDIQAHKAKQYEAFCPLPPVVGSLKPIHDWPMWARNGGVEVIDSADGMTVRMVNRHKTRELAAKLRPVNAMIQSGEKLGEGLSKVAAALVWAGAKPEWTKPAIEVKPEDPPAE